jgi:hypothetical protein
MNPSDPPLNCDPNPCLNSGECTSADNDMISCICQDGFFGNICEFTNEDLSMVSTRFSDFFNYVTDNYDDSYFKSFTSNLDSYLELVSNFPQSTDNKVTDILSEFISNISFYNF